MHTNQNHSAREEFLTQIEHACTPSRSLITCLAYSHAVASVLSQESCLPVECVIIFKEISDMARGPGFVPKFTELSHSPYLAPNSRASRTRSKRHLELDRMWLCYFNLLFCCIVASSLRPRLLNLIACICHLST
jgi:hypothetical protein